MPQSLHITDHLTGMRCEMDVKEYGREGRQLMLAHCHCQENGERQLMLAHCHCHCHVQMAERDVS